MMKVNEMVLMYVSEMKRNLHDNHSHQNNMIFVDMMMKIREERSPKAGIQCYYTLRKSLQGVFDLLGL